MLHVQELQVDADTWTHVAGEEPLPGYRLIEPLGKGGFGEVWKCQVPGGICKAMKFVFGNLNSMSLGSVNVEQELGAIERIKDIRHPFLLSTERIEVAAGELIIVMELADKDLDAVFRECKAAGMPGIPRTDLLTYLLEAAEALDLMNQRHGLQHLDIKPRNLFLVSNHTKVADFGLVNDQLAAGGGKANPKMGGITPIYASPEVQQGKISRHSDQYSLAIVYQELLTGTLPFVGKNARQLLMQHLTARPNLEPLPVQDRVQMERALAKEPEQRFPSCLAFVEALAYGTDAFSKAADSGHSRTPAPLKLPPAHKTLSGVYLHRRSAVRGEQNLGDAENTVLTSGNVEPGEAGPTGAARRAVGALKQSYKYLNCICRSPLGEVWKIQEADGRERLAHFLSSVLTNDDQATARLIAGLRDLRHPILPPVEVFRNAAGQVVLVGDCFDQSLWDRFQQCCAEGLPGIPHSELLDYLSPAAEALDELYQKHVLCHLAINPRTLAIRGGRIVLTDFGLVELAWLPTGQTVLAVNASYAAPESAQTKVSSPAGDQYSLALLYLDLVTGARRRPVRAGARTDGAGAHQRNLDLLPITDREIVARALHADPRKRFPSCAEFLQALREATLHKRRTEDRISRLPDVIPLASLLCEAEPPILEVPPLDQLVTQQLAAEAGKLKSRVFQKFRYTITPTGAIEHKFPVRPFAESMRLKLDGFRQLWKAHLARQDERSAVFHITASQSLWQRFVRQEEGLKITVSLSVSGHAKSELAEATVRIQVMGGDVGSKMLTDLGPELLSSLRSFLQPSRENRRHQRLPYLQPLRVHGIFPDLEWAKPIVGTTKDLSRGGIGIVLPQAPPTAHLFLHFHAVPELEPWAIHVRVVRVHPMADGWYEVGTSFATERAS